MSYRMRCDDDWIQVSKYPQNIKISGNGDRCLVFWPKGLPLLSTVKLFRSAIGKSGMVSPWVTSTVDAIATKHSWFV